MMLLLLLLSLFSVPSLQQTNGTDSLAIENYLEYLRIPSVHPNINFDECISFLKKQAGSLGLPIQVYQYYPNKPIVVISWIGKKPYLPSILLNGHMDVVPVYRDKWTRDPFAAEMDENGNIYARGAQDMKAASIQYLEAIRRLKNANVTLTRTIHVSFMPDEEIGGAEGMETFVNSKEFKKLKIGFALDEGSPNPDGTFLFHNGEKTRWVLHIHCPGQPGHGSFLVNNTAGEKASRILSRLYEFRAQERKKLDDDPSLTQGDVTSINLTVMKGGVQSNVIPEEFILTFDFRIAVTVNLKEFEQTLNNWCAEAGEGVWIEYEIKESFAPITKLFNSYVMVFKKTFEDMKLSIKPTILAPVTDIRFARAKGIPALGFSPMNWTPILAHDNNEYLNRDVFLRGIEIYRKLILEIANNGYKIKK